MTECFCPEPEVEETICKRCKGERKLPYSKAKKKKKV